MSVKFNLLINCQWLRYPSVEKTKHQRRRKNISQYLFDTVQFSFCTWWLPKIELRLTKPRSVYLPQRMALRVSASCLRVLSYHTEPITCPTSHPLVVGSVTCCRVLRRTSLPDTKGNQRPYTLWGTRILMIGTFPSLAVGNNRGIALGRKWLLFRPWLDLDFCHPRWSMVTLAI